MERNIVTLADDPEGAQYVLEVVDNSHDYGQISKNTFFKYDNNNKPKMLEKAREYKEATGKALKAIIQDYTLPSTEQTPV